MANRKKGSREKKEKMRKMEEKRRMNKMILGISIIAILLVGTGMSFSLFGNDDVQSPYNSPSDATESEIMIPTSGISSTAKYFRETIDGVTVKYFVIKGGDGQVHTAFDACDVCFREKKGYSQDGSKMVCNNCGNQYSTNGIGTENSAGGGCWPGYLKTKIEGSNLVIEKSELAKGKYYFE